MLVELKKKESSTCVIDIAVVLQQNHFAMEINNVFPNPPHLHRILHLQWLVPARPERLDHHFNPLLQLLIQFSQKQNKSISTRAHVFLITYMK